VSFLLLAIPCATSQDFPSAASDFASKITGRTAVRLASLTFKNRSSLPDPSVALIRIDLQRELQNRGWRLRKPDETNNVITVTLAENLDHYVWTAEIDNSETTETVLLELARPKEDSALPRGFVSLSRTLLIASDTPLLDVTLLEGKVAEGSHLLALTPAAVQLYQFQGGQWNMLQSIPLSLEPVVSRDLRGRISPTQGGGFDGYLPGVHCTGGVMPSLGVTCRTSDDPWPLSDDRQRLGFYAARRNFFNGVIMVQGAQSENAGPFFSAAMLNDRAVYASTNGRFGVQGQNQSSITATSATWGNNIAGILTSCQTDLVLVTAAGDFDANDTVTAFRFAGSEFSAISEPIPFSGAVQSIKTSSDRQQALAVVASLSGRYEAYLLTAHCGA
jgi:hypothetical protein